MKTPTIGLNGTAILALAGLAVAGYVAYRVYRTGQAVSDAVSETFDSAKKTALEIIDFLPNQFNIAATNAPRMDELLFDEMGNVIGSQAIDTAQQRYAKPPDTSSGSREATPSGSLSFFGQGKSFKDLSDPYAVNPFRPIELFQH